MSARSVFWIAVSFLAAAALHAQPRGSFAECNDEGWRGRGTRGYFCEVRELTLAAPRVLTVDAGENGGISVTGESRRDLQVRARVQAWAADDAEAERIARAVTVSSDGALRSDGPARGGRTGWSVSFDVVAPREIDLDLEANNGGISVAGVRGELLLETRNGGIKLDGAAGNVRGRTVNGGVDARLTGNSWDGAGLELVTTNGGVRLRIPEDYSARLETGTVNGGVDIDFPVTMQGRIGKEISTTLGRGGPLVRVATTNGQVRVSRQDTSLRRVE
jgi:hypothetical protein